MSDEIARLKAENELLKAALKPFAIAADKADESDARIQRFGMGPLGDNASTGLGVTFGQLRRARSLLIRLNEAT